jgi:GH15 family glucan-1,4-alpha-glucosidase
MAYQPIEDYGVIGNMRTVALVGMNGSIDWFCCPNFDSPSVFASILDDNEGGMFRIAPISPQATTKQFYWPETNVLVTRFLSEEGVGEIIDFMPIVKSESDRRCHIMRQVNVVRGSVHWRVECDPAFNYGRDDHAVQVGEQGAHFRSPSLGLQLCTGVPLKQRGNGAVGEFVLNEGETETFGIVEIFSSDDPGVTITEIQGEGLFRDTVDYWRAWLSQCTYKGRWREQVERSALALKLMTYEPTGAIVAAPTTSLPEELGGVRNWDYRYTWIRDAAFTLYGLLRIGFTEAAGAFMEFIEARCHELEPDGSLQVMYGIDGRHKLTEETLDNLEGYRGSGPVRVGNGAYNQLQLDIYGELMDAVYLYNKYGQPISYDFWTHLRDLTDWVCDHWQLEDEGIWEVRGGRKHFLYSKVMCWVAVDRALRLADRRSFPADRQRWLEVRDAIYEEIMEKGWNPKLNSFVQSYGGDTLDASSLIMPLVFLMSPNDPRMLSTLDAINRSPGNGGLVSASLVYRYNVDASPDGISGGEGTFNMCSFWLVEALTRAGFTDREKLDEARLMFEKMLGYANHLGLYAEETGSCGEALGNFPQAFTHISLISAAFNLDRALGGGA